MLNGEPKGNPVMNPTSTTPAHPGLPGHVEITETLLRDGLQIEDRIVPTEKKIDIARALLAAGFASLEIGAFVHPERVPQMADTDQLLRTLLDETDAPLYTLIFNERSAMRAIDAGARHARLVVSATDGHSRSNSGRSVDEALERLAVAAERLTKASVHLEAGVATSFICPFDGLTPPENVLRVVGRLREFGVQRVTLADTIGNAVPLQIRDTVTAVRHTFPDQEIGLHLHDTYNVGMANAWEGLNLGIAHYDAALGGLGGCPFAPGASGNIGTDDLLHLLHRTGIPTGVDPDPLPALREKIAEAVGHPLASSLAGIPATPSPLLPSASGTVS